MLVCKVLALYFGSSASHFDDCKVPLQAATLWRDSVTIIFAFVIIVIIMSCTTGREESCMGLILDVK